MTREEAKKEKPYTDLPNGNHFSRHSYDAIIDKIYNSFENKTCKTCEFAKDINGYEHRCLLTSVKLYYEFSCSAHQKNK